MIRSSSEERLRGSPEVDLSMDKISEKRNSEEEISEEEVISEEEMEEI